ncbi:MAG TPA: 4Fe-4S dicluster domain-containing protein [Candidatus Eisenbergiella merdavium]|uniref:succinate dehydrogenase n=1 Tax=Candidatus Eisenbergiella merdavium TaxID=2838551 RepID=A0A9D2NH14_9FIRM|nr:4Fe-4S dicluster domain-containing protein [Candidatus Eisenbergiella merdavium]
MLIKIKRQRDADSEPYWQSFACDADPEMTISALLDKLNYTDDLYDTEGKPAPRIRWECSCQQKMCGACAMVINGIPRLACATFLRDIKGGELTLEPLSKFPVIADLIVDRSIIEENLHRARAYLGEYKGIGEKSFPQLYSVAKCLKCGLCLEACPNYIRGENFFGALFANEMYLLSLQSADRGEELRKEYARHFAGGCSKVLSCVEVCPMGIDTLASMAKLNRPGRAGRR